MRCVEFVAAVRNQTGHYYLNGNWRIDFPRDLRFIGTIFHYERKPHGFYAPEAIWALGPITEDIYIVVSFLQLMNELALIFFLTS